MAVLDIHIPKVVESLLVGIYKHAYRMLKGSKKPGGGVRYELSFECVNSCGVLSHPGGVEGDGKVGKKGSDGELHLVYVLD